MGILEGSFVGKSNDSSPESDSVMVYFLFYYKSMLIFELEINHSLEDLPEHGLKVLHDLGVHDPSGLLSDSLCGVIRTCESQVTPQSNCLLGKLKVSRNLIHCSS